MEFIKEDNEVYKIIKVKVTKDNRLRDIEEEIATLQEEKEALEKV